MSVWHLTWIIPVAMLLGGFIAVLALGSAVAPRR